ncbi:HdeD family acid-resistance protein [Bacteroidota bacterium]
MAAQLHKNWRLLTINGVIAIIFGALALFIPQGTIITIAKYFGFVLLLGGLILLIAALMNRQKKKDYSLLLIEGIVSLVVGLIILLFTEQTLEIFVILVGIWAIILGIMQLVMLASIHEASSSKTILLVNGLLTLLFGVLIFFNPFSAAIIFTRIIGIIALAFGILMVYLSIKIKNID